MQPFALTSPDTAGSTGGLLAAALVCAVMLLIGLGLALRASRRRLQALQRQHDAAGQARDRAEQAHAQAKRGRALSEQARDAALADGASLATLLDHSGQGFLTIDTTLCVQPRCNAACATFFDGPPAGKDLASLMASAGFFDEEDPRDVLRRNFALVFQSAAHRARQAAFIDLLPEQVTLGARTLEVQYRWLPSQQLMVILTDISETVALKDSIRREHKRVEYLINALERRAELINTLSTWRRFLTNGVDACLARGGQAGLAALHREVHTFKGLFAQDGFSAVPAALHLLEDALAGHITDMPLHQRFQQSFEATGVTAALEADLAVLHEALGVDLSQAERLREVPERAIADVAAAFARWSRQLPPALRSAALHGELAGAIDRLGLQPLSRMLEPHFKAAQGLAPQLGKALSPPRCEGPEVYLDAERTGRLMQSLVHVFRNAVDHGLETTEEREDIGKPAAGRIVCHMAVCEGLLTLQISDDGQGIDAARLREVAVRKGVITAAQAEAMDDDAARQLVFADGLSTREQVSRLSGRGVGLAAVRETAAELGGVARVSAVPGEGAVFTLILPLSGAEYVIDPAAAAAAAPQDHAAPEVAHAA